MKARGIPLRILQSVRENKENLSRLILLGTVHNDPQGFKRLREFLEREKPDCILVELSPYALRYRLRHQRYLHKTLTRNLRSAAAESNVPLIEAFQHPEVAAIRRQISLPMEYRAAASYAQTGLSGVFPVDYSLFSRKWIATWPELLSPRNLCILLTQPSTTRSISTIYELAARSMEKNASPSIFYETTFQKSEKDPLWAEREYHMAMRIIHVLRAFSPQNPVYLGGWWHLTSGGPTSTLRDFLGVEPSKCFLLDRSHIATNR